MGMYVTQVSICSKYNLKHFHLSLRTTELTKPIMTMHLYMYLNKYTYMYIWQVTSACTSFTCMYVCICTFSCLFRCLTIRISNIRS